MRPEKKVVMDAPEAYTALGIPAEWVPVIQKMGYLTVEAMRKVSAGKLFNELCGMNKKHRMGLQNPTQEEVKQWLK
jgi:lysyl-tRNA synthetase class 2